MNLSRSAYVILGILAIEDGRSGYDIRKTIEGSVGHFWGESYGQIYPTLKKLAGEKLIVESGEAGKQRRRQYSIMQEGRDVLRDWLGKPFVDDPPRNEFLLKLFFGNEAAPDIAVGHIHDLQHRNRAALREMERIQTLAPKVNAGQPGLRYWMLTVELGIAMTRAVLEWSDEALVALETGAPESEHNQA
jgi:DNA-binding PadR family transcriptional regulator